MGKRANGEGTVFRRADGDWVAQLTVPPRGTQKGYRKTFRGKTRTVVLERREAFKRELASDRPIRRKAITLETFGEEHFDTTLTNAVSLGHLRDSTLVTYRHIWATHIGPVIGHVRLAT